MDGGGGGGSRVGFGRRTRESEAAKLRPDCLQVTSSACNNYKSNPAVKGPTAMQRLVRHPEDPTPTISEDWWAMMKRPGASFAGHPGCFRWKPGPASLAIPFDFGGYPKTVWREIFGPVSPGFSGTARPRGPPLDRRGPPRTSTCTNIQPRRPIRRPFRDERQIRPECLQAPRLSDAQGARGHLFRASLVDFGAPASRFWCQRADPMRWCASLGSPGRITGTTAPQ